MKPFSVIAHELLRVGFAVILRILADIQRNIALLH